MRIIIFSFLSLFVFFSCNRHKKNRIVEKQPRINYLKPKFKLYIENSGSVHGYFQNDKSGFKSNLKKIISSINSDDFSLNFAVYDLKSNKTVLTKNIRSNPESIVRYIDQMKPKNVKNNLIAGSEFSSIFNEIMKDRDSSTVFGIVSDFIPAGGVNDSEDLIKMFLNKQLKIDSNFSVAIVKFSSRFHGTYYSQSLSKEYKLNKFRPFYIWFIGSYYNIQELGVLDYNFYTKNTFAEFKGLSVFTNVLHDFTYSILPKTLNSKNITYSSKYSNQHEVKGIKVNQKDKSSCTFSIAIDLSNVTREESYIQDTSNYVYDKNYKLLNVYKIDGKNIVLNENKTKPISDSDLHYVVNTNSTHLLVFESKYRPTNLSFSLKKTFPKWLLYSHSDDENYIINNLGKNINDYESAVKTFNFKVFSNALEDVFIDDNKYYFTAKINVEYESSNSNLYIIIFIIIIILLGFYIYRKNK